MRIADKLIFASNSDLKYYKRIVGLQPDDAKDFVCQLVVDPKEISAKEHALGTPLIMDKEKLYFNVCWWSTYSRPKWVVNAIQWLSPPTPLGKGGATRALFVIHLGLLYIPLHGLETIIHSFSILREEPIRLFILGNDDSKSLLYQAL